MKHIFFLPPLLVWVAKLFYKPVFSWVALPKVGEAWRVRQKLAKPGRVFKDET